MLNRQEEKKDTIHGWSEGGQRAGVAEEVFSNLVWTFAKTGQHCCLVNSNHTTNLFLGAKVQTETFSASNQRAVQEAGFQKTKTTPKNQHYWLCENICYSKKTFSIMSKKVWPYAEEIKLYIKQHKLILCCQLVLIGLAVLHAWKQFYVLYLPCALDGLCNRWVTCLLQLSLLRHTDLLLIVTLNLKVKRIYSGKKNKNTYFHWTPKP